MLMNETGENNKIEWLTMKVRVDTLKPYERNPRKIAPADYEKLKQSIARIGFHSPLKATPDGRVMGGHVRLRALKDMGIEEVFVSMPDRDLTENEFKEVLITDNTHVGEFDSLILGADFTVSELEAFGVEQIIINEINPLGAKIKKNVTDDTGYMCLVEFDNESDQAKFYDEMQSRNIQCKLMS